MTDRPPFDERSSRRYATKPVPVAAGTIDLIELALRRDDPTFVRRFHRLQRASRINAVAVVLSLLASAVLLVVGLATASTTGLIGGGVALMIAFTIDGHHRRRLAHRGRVELRVRAASQGRVPPSLPQRSALGRRPAGGPSGVPS